MVLLPGPLCDEMIATLTRLRDMGVRRVELGAYGGVVAEFAPVAAPVGPAEVVKPEEGDQFSKQRGPIETARKLRQLWGQAHGEQPRPLKDNSG